jgi:hypothetical protein
LHALILVGWLHGRDRGSLAGSDIGVAVDSPADDLPTFTLLEPRSEPTQPTKSQRTTPSNPEPLPLPKDVVTPAASNIKTTSHSDSSQQTAPSLSKFGGASPLHGKVTTNKTIVYILDRSGSMGPDGLLKRAINSLNASLAQLGPDSRFQIVAYNGGVVSFARESVAPTPVNLRLADEWLKELSAEGRSDHRAGFREALSCRPNALYLLTDADDLEESDVRAIRTLMRTPVYLTAVVFGSQPATGATPLGRLVDAMGGSIIWRAEPR